MVRMHTGQEKTEILSRTFASRDTALVYAELCGDGAFIQAKTGYQDDAQVRLC